MGEDERMHEARGASLDSADSSFAIPGAPDALTLIDYQALYVEKIRAILAIRGAARAGMKVSDEVHTGLLLVVEKLDHLERTHRVPFAATCSALGIDTFLRDSLITIAAPHIDPEIREAIGHFWGVPGRRHVDAALLLTMFLDDRRQRIARAAELKEGSALHAAGLVEFASASATSPQLEHELIATSRLLRLVEGAFGLDPRHRGIAKLLAVDPGAAVGVLEPQRLEETARLLNAAHDTLRGGRAIVMFAGPTGAGKLRLARTLAAADAKQLLVVETSQLPTEPSRLSKAIVALAHEAELLSARLVLRRVDAYISDARSAAHLRHAIATCPFRVWITSDVDSSRVHAPELADLAHVRISIGFPDLALRRAAWRAELAAVGQNVAEDRLRILASDYPLSRSAIEATARIARALAASPADVDSMLPHVAETQMQGQLGRFARRSRSQARVRDVVMSESTREQINELLAALRNRAPAMDRWGLADKHAIGRGIVALFNGPPGTGKTMTATALANELKLPLYRIDASTIVDKFVGETEKNLVRLFEEAAASRAALLFDEADALFGKRLEAKDSTDRSANMQVNMLLNLIEDYDGFVVLTTNLKGALDDAFLRRIIYKIVFDKPDVDELTALWEYHLPPSIARAGDVDTVALAEEFDQLCGGDVKNAVLRATLAASGDDAITQQMLRRAVLNELRANGKVVQG